MKHINKVINEKLMVVMLVMATVLILSCGTEGATQSSDQVYVPEEPNYQDSSMWITYLNDSLDTGADVFYLVSTWEGNWTDSVGRVSYWADPVAQERHRRHMGIEMNRAAQGYMADGNNYYAPYYRHVAFDAYVTRNLDTINTRFDAVASHDILRAFNHYYEHYNQGKRPFILAGFSQGGQGVKMLLKQLTSRQYKQLVAAYIFGYGVSADELKQYPTIRPATDATSTGVTILYNSVKDVKYKLSPICDDNVLCINPVNWHTDETPATLDDTVTVHVDTLQHLLVVEGYSGSEYKPAGGLINVGDLHGAEPWLYQEHIKKNMRDRINSYRKK